MKRRIIGVALASSVLAVMLFALPLAVAVERSFLSGAQSGLERTALRAATTVGPDFASGDPAELTPPGPGDQLGLYDGRGQLVSGTGPSQADAAARTSLSGGVGQSLSDGWLIVSVPVSSGEEVVGAVRAAAPSSDLSKKTAFAWSVMALIAALAISVAVMIARTLARRVSKPLEDLAGAADRLGRGEFSVRARPVGITEIDTVGDTLNSTAERLNDLVHRERQIAANASHQLRTPLAGLRVTLESALASPTGDLAQAARSAIASADRLEATIDDLIALTRGTVPPGNTVDLAVAFAQAAERWREPLLERGRALQLALPQGVPRVACAPTALVQILDVLVDNATTHGRGSVTVTARQVDVAVAIDVSDEGGQLDAATDIFARGVSASGGTGIGLALARRLANDQGGRLHLSQTHPTTRFTLLLKASG